jgi:hypothetical protein
MPTSGASRRPEVSQPVPSSLSSSMTMTRTASAASTPMTAPSPAASRGSAWSARQDRGSGSRGPEAHRSCGPAWPTRRPMRRYGWTRTRRAGGRCAWPRLVAPQRDEETAKGRPRLSVSPSGTAGASSGYATRQVPVREPGAKAGTSRHSIARHHDGIRRDQRRVGQSDGAMTASSRRLVASRQIAVLMAPDTAVRRKRRPNQFPRCAGGDELGDTISFVRTRRLGIVPPEVHRSISRPARTRPARVGGGSAIGDGYGSGASGDQGQCRRSQAVSRARPRGGLDVDVAAPRAD